jgi:hypothetical protein
MIIIIRRGTHGYGELKEHLASELPSSASGRQTDCSFDVPPAYWLLKMKYLNSFIVIAIDNECSDLLEFSCTTH